MYPEPEDFIRGVGQIDEKASEKEIVTHYKTNFKNTAGNISANIIRKPFSSSRAQMITNGVIVCFEKEGRIILCL